MTQAEFDKIVERATAKLGEQEVANVLNSAVTRYGQPLPANGRAAAAKILGVLEVARLRGW